jgi:hypothetical protein
MRVGLFPVLVVRGYFGREHEDRRDMPKRYWFPAKRYGWGWGPPSTWQGWAVIAAFVALAVAGVLLFPPKPDLALFVGYITCLVIGLTAVCWSMARQSVWRESDKQDERSLMY